LFYSDDKDSTLDEDVDLPVPGGQADSEKGYQSETSGSEAGIVVTPSPSRVASAIAAVSYFPARM